MRYHFQNQPKRTSIRFIVSLLSVAIAALCVILAHGCISDANANSEKTELGSAASTDTVPEKIPANLVRNPGFEDIDERTGIPSSWQFINSGGKGGSEGKGWLEKDNPHSGKYCVGAEKTNDKYYSSWATGFPVKPSEKYFLSFWYRTKDSHKNSLVVAYFMDAGNAIESSASFHIPGSQEWKKYETTFSTSDKTKDIQLQFRLTGNGTVSFFDDVLVYEKGYERRRVINGKAEMAKIPDSELKSLLDNVVMTVKNEDFSQNQKIKIADIDPTAIGRSSSVVSGGMTPAHLIKWQMTQPLIPGMDYDIYLIVKVVKKGEGGSAFKCGIFNTKGYYSIREHTVNMKDVASNEWTIFRMVARHPLYQGDYIFISPSGNEDVSEIRVDDILILPGNSDVTEFYRKWKSSGGLNFNLFPDSFGSISLSIEEKKLDMGYLINCDERTPAPNAFCGIVIDYLDKAEGINRKSVLLSLLPKGANIRQNSPVEAGGTLFRFDKIVDCDNAPNGKYRESSVDTDTYAPANWNGKTRISFVSSENISFFSGLLLRPSLKDIHADGIFFNTDSPDSVFIDMKSLNFLKGKIRQDKFNTAMEKLKEAINLK